MWLNVDGHGGTTGAQTSLKWGGKPTVLIARWGVSRRGSSDHLIGLEEEHWRDRDAEDFLPFVNPNLSHFLPHLHDRLTTNPAGIIACTMTQHGHQDTQESVTNIA
jgi:hypothetical protein